MRIHYLQHVPFEDLANIEDWAREHNHSIGVTRLFNDEPLPTSDDYDLLVILGGPMNIYEEDRYSWLKPEKFAIYDAIRAGRKVLGICLGSQLIASVLGTRVFQNHEKEIGWLPITLTEEARHNPLCAELPEAFTVFHWHGDTFDLPFGAIQLASSEACKNQAFLYGNNVLGLQFHLEATPESIEKMLAHESEDITPGNFVQTAEMIRAQQEFYQNSREIMRKILDRFTAKI